MSEDNGFLERNVAARIALQYISNLSEDILQAYYVYFQDGAPGVDDDFDKEVRTHCLVIMDKIKNGSVNELSDYEIVSLALAITVTQLELIQREQAENKTEK